MEKKPYHHLPDGTFRNPEGSPKRDSNTKWSYKIFNEERKKIKINYPDSHVVSREQVLEDLKANGRFSIRPRARPTLNAACSSGAKP